MLLLRSLTFFICLALWTAVIVTILSPLALLRNEKTLMNMAYIWCRVTLKLLEMTCNLKVRVSGQKNIPIIPFILACKHQSVLETIFLMIYIRCPVFIIKKQLTNVPFYGWFLNSMGMITIDREKGLSSLKKLLRQCRKVFDDKRNLIIFPEGTRTQPFESKEFKLGVLAIKKKFKHIPIIPVALNSGLFWSKNSLLIKPGIADIQILPEIRCSDSGEFIISLQKQINEKSYFLCKQAWLK
tara:strand:+ start:217 stop:939 length:723 start_codon:yes stop_codon:yes gene_type:complete